MSAFIVSDNTIRAIITFAFGPRGVGTIKKLPGDNRPGDYRTLTDYTPEQVGQQLLDENYRSVNYRYRESDAAPVYKHTAVLSGTVGHDEKSRRPIRRPLAALDIIKLCNCLEYQSCEHESWETSWARDFLDRVKDCAVDKLPGYDSAPWGLHD